ncbi:hypothetical protein Y032_0734g1931 [Ancylostoma ceylanicum]|uniref:Uncharacterized protein n=1 Tax=Ancylostoma ceylanicum TaxID=53326 RepID=A0A016WF17_9BILA|nr:hypothetical protein Y032_0734g1931 [Ancylostoma ceylanicum]
MREYSANTSSGIKKYHLRKRKPVALFHDPCFGADHSHRKLKMSFDFDLTAPFLPEFSTKDQSEHRHKIRPVQILAPSSTNGFRLNEGALSSVLAHTAIANKKVEL